MYLFVSVFLMLAAMGLFTELYMLQAAELWSRQKTAAEIMSIWHNSAYALAKEKAASVTPDCRLSPSPLPSGVAALCDVQLVDPSGPYCAGCERHYLPVGYQWVAQMRFPSVVYRDATTGTRYLATFIPKEAEGETAWLGYTADEFLAQMKKTRISPMSYGQVIQGTCAGGTVSGLWFSTSMYDTSKKQICYPVPAGVSIGSVGYLSVL